MLHHRMRSLVAPLSALTLGAVALTSCAGQPPAPVAAPPAPPAAPEPAPAPPAPVAEPAPPAAMQAMLLEGLGFENPESVLYDPEQDVYFVSNVAGDPVAADDNGFISKVDPEGKVLELKWVDGAKESVQLNAPKGMGISGPLLYVADIQWVRLYDRKSGEPRGKLFISGATFLNGIAVDSDGVVYVSDTGWKPGKDGFEATGTDAVFRIDPKRVTPEVVAKDKTLGNPNGLATSGEGLWAVTAEGQYYRVTSEGKMEQSGKLPGKGLDGVIALDGGDLLVSSWETATIYRGTPGGQFEAIAEHLEGPADIGFDSKRGRLLVPQMTQNKIAIYDIPGTASSPSTDEDAAPAPQAPSAGATASATPAEPAQPGTTQPSTTQPAPAVAGPKAAAASAPAGKQADAKKPAGVKSPDNDARQASAAAPKPPPKK